LIFLYVTVRVLKKQDISVLRSGRKLTLIGSAIALIVFFIAAVS